MGSGEVGSGSIGGLTERVSPRVVSGIASPAPIPERFELPSSDGSAAGRKPMRSREIRRIFFMELLRLVGVVWPILSGVLSAMVGPGLLIGHIEGWRIVDALYFTFVTGLTIGYGDLTPRHVVSRLLAVVIGLAGIMLTGLIAALSVQALQVAARKSED